MKSLKAQHSFLSDAHEQIEILEHGQIDNFNLVPFQQKLETIGLYPFKPNSIDIFQVNIAKMCNQNLQALSCRCRSGQKRNYDKRDCYGCIAGAGSSCGSAVA